MAKLVGNNGLVVAVEPHHDNYKRSVENVKLNGLRNVITLNVAACSEEQEVKLFVRDPHNRHSLVEDFGKGFVLVKARPLDYVLEGLGVSKVDCVKVDVEGRRVGGPQGTAKDFEEV